MTKLFIAIREEDAGLTSTLLKSNVERRICHRLSDAVATLDASFDLILCGLHFDDGRMFDLLRHAKADPDTRGIPFVAVKGAGRALTPAIYKSIVIALDKLGGAAFVDLPHLISRHGQAQTLSLLNDGLQQLTGSRLLLAPAGQGAGMKGVPGGS